MLRRRLEQRRNDRVQKTECRPAPLISQGGQSFERLSSEQAQAALQQRGFAGNTVRNRAQRPQQTYDANRYRGSFDTIHGVSDLNRSYNARKFSGYQRYNNAPEFRWRQDGQPPNASSAALLSSYKMFE